MQHIPVMLKEALHYLAIKPDGIYVDCTFGGGGHSQAILSLMDQGKLIAFDQDADAIVHAQKRFAKDTDKLHIVHDNFVRLTENLNALGIEKVDGILYDLGVSSHHFDTPERGFSYQYDAPLDMRMNQSQSLTAREIVNSYSDKELMHILFRFGEESFAPLIANTIVKERNKKTIETTFELVDVIRKALPEKILRKKGHPAKKTFQALRIAVNQELDVLKESLQQALNHLHPKGTLVVISFHSLEDRIVKQVFHQATTIDYPHQLVAMPTIEPDFIKMHKKVITPSIEEISENHRAHSAKLRAIRKI